LEDLSQQNLDGTIGYELTSNRDSFKSGFWMDSFGESFDHVPAQRSTWM
jgi:hypothetical protein